MCFFDQGSVSFMLLLRSKRVDVVIFCLRRWRADVRQGLRVRGEDAEAEDCRRGELRESCRKLLATDELAFSNFSMFPPRAEGVMARGCCR